MHAKTMLRTAAVLAAAVAILAGSPLATAKGPITGTAPVSPQPEEDDLEAGLAVTYYYAYFEDVGDITRLVSGKPGEPIMILDHRTKSGKVLTARKPMGVGAEIRGLIKLDQAGSYIFRVLSNDGVELLIGGERLAYDPAIHGDRFYPAGRIRGRGTGLVRSRDRLLPEEGHLGFEAAVDAAGGGGGDGGAGGGLRPRRRLDGPITGRARAHRTGGRYRLACCRGAGSPGWHRPGCLDRHPRPRAWRRARPAARPVDAGPSMWAGLYGAGVGARPRFAARAAISSVRGRKLASIPATPQARSCSKAAIAMGRAMKLLRSPMS